MKHILFFISALIFCNIAFCQNDETANVLGVERSTADAFTKHNSAFIGTVFSDNATIITSQGDLIGKSQLIQYLPNINSVVLSDMKVTLKGTTAIVIGVQLETGKDVASGSVYTTKCRFMDVLEKVKGQWQIISSQATSMVQQ